MPVVYNWVECPVEDLAVGDMIRMSSENESRIGPIEQLVRPGAGSIVGSVYVDGIRYVFRRGESVERWEQVDEILEVEEVVPVEALERKCRLLVQAKNLHVGDFVIRIEGVDIEPGSFIVKDVWVEYICRGTQTVGVALVWPDDQYLFDGPPGVDPFRWSTSLLLTIDRL